MGASSCEGGTAAFRPFTLNVSCKIQCAQKPEAGVKVKTALWFHPRLRAGDGNLPTPLTANLSLEATRACLEAASSTCGGSMKVAAAEPTSLSSGIWSAPFQLGCGPSQPTVDSPFDPKYGFNLNRVPPPPPQALEPDLAIGKGWLVTDGKPAGCRHPIVGNLCFGDCINIKTNVQTLASSAPLGREPFTVCGDPLYDEMHGQKPYSWAEMKFQCENFFWKSLSTREGVGPMSCAAIRGTIECGNFLGSVSAPK